ncbi:hypothetical protein QQ045_026543 [Rhodiola kirilowii]
MERVIRIWLRELLQDVGVILPLLSCCTIASFKILLSVTLSSSSDSFLAHGKPVFINEHQVEKFLYTTLKLNSAVMTYSRMAAVVLVSLPPPPANHPAYLYME